MAGQHAVEILYADCLYLLFCQVWGAYADLEILYENCHVLVVSVIRPVLYIEFWSRRMQLRQ